MDTPRRFDLNLDGVGTIGGSLTNDLRWEDVKVLAQFPVGGSDETVTGRVDELVLGDHAVRRTERFEESVVIQDLFDVRVAGSIVERSIAVYVDEDTVAFVCDLCVREV
jgi:hypothetical protein